MIIIKVMFMIFGIANNSALTATFSPSFFPINLKDRSILNVFTTLNFSAQEVKHR